MSQGRKTRFETTGPNYAWRWIVHPYAAAALLSLLLIVPYSFPFTLPILFPPYTHYATLEQHLMASTGMSMVIFAGVMAGLIFSGKNTEKARLENVAFFSSNEAILLFGGLLILSWLMMLVVTPLAFSQLANGVRAARESMKSLGGLSFLGRMSSVCLLPLLISLRLRGRPFVLLTVITVVLTLAQSAATTERFQVVQLFIVLIAFLALYQPHSMKLSTFAIGMFVLVGFLGANLAQRALVSVPKSLRAQIERQIPEIALGTLLTYPSDTTNKLYFQMLQTRLDHGSDNGFYFAIPNAFLGRVGIELGSQGSDAAPERGAYIAGPASALDFNHGRNPVMTNAGGPTEDFIDFGILFPVILFLKFFLFARIYVGARRLDPLCAALFPAFFTSAIVYTQENMLYEVAVGMPVLIMCLLVPWFRHRATRSLLPAVA